LHDALAVFADTKGTGDNVTYDDANSKLKVFGAQQDAVRRDPTRWTKRTTPSPERPGGPLPWSGVLSHERVGAFGGTPGQHAAR
jgi:hypothetical protein